VVKIAFYSKATGGTSLYSWLISGAQDQQHDSRQKHQQDVSETKKFGAATISRNYLCHLHARSAT
jgi:hypothetical protein